MMHKSEAIRRNPYLVSTNFEALNAHPGEHVLQLLVGPWSAGNVTEPVIVYSGKEPGFTTPTESGFHVHPTYDQMMYVFSGTMMSQIEGEEPFAAGPGDFVTYRAGLVHKNWVEGTEMACCLGINIPVKNSSVKPS